MTTNLRNRSAWVIAWLTGSLALLAVMVPRVHDARADSVTLTSGEIVDGTIISETTTNLEVELRKYKGVSKVFEKANIKTDNGW